MKLITLKISPAQKSKLRNMKGIKINPKHRAMNGEGMSILVDENNYNALSKRFDNNQGLLFKLSKSEIDANKDLDKVADDEVREEIQGAGLFKHKKSARKTMKKIVDELEGEMKGKGLIKSIKKGVKKTARKAVKTVKKEAKDLAKEVKDEAKDLAKEVQKDAEEGLKKTIKKVRNQAKKAIPPELVETVDLVKKTVDAIDKFDIKKIDKAIKSIPAAYKKEIKNTYIGQAIREALVIGTDVAMDSAISAMYSNPFLAPVAPMLQIAWETEQASGQPMTRGVIEKIGLGLGLGLRASGKGLRASGEGLRASGKGLRAGAGLRAGSGLMAGSGNKVEVIKHKVDPFYMENKLTNRPTEKTEIVKQKTHTDSLIMGAGGGSAITGLFLEKPVMSGILKARPLKRVSMLEGKHS